MVTHHWGMELVDPEGKDLPSLKFRFVSDYLRNIRAKGKGNIEKAKSKLKVLEIGSGNGKILRSIKKILSHTELFGCDVKNPSVDPKKDYSFTLIKENDLPYPDQLFDVVVVVDVLEHVKEYAHYISEIRRILKNDGVFLAFIPCEGQLMSAYSVSRLFFGRDVFLKTKEHVNSFKRDEILHLLEKNISLEKIQYSYHLLGQIMDAVLFTLLLNKRIEKLFWEKNQYYNTKKAAKSSYIAKVFNAVLSSANVIAYTESRILSNISLCSAGIHLVAKK